MDKELNEILEYYGANLYDSGEPDEAPESEGIVTLSTLEEEKQLKQDWRRMAQPRATDMDGRGRAM